MTTLHTSTLYKIYDNKDLISNRGEVIITSYVPDKSGQRVMGASLSCGLLSKPLKFSGKNSFSKIFDLGDKFSRIRDIAIGAGVNGFNQGVYSTQYFTDGGYTTFELNTRIVSDLYKSDVLTILASLMILMAPPDVDAGEMAAGVKNALVQAGLSSKDALKEIGGTIVNDLFKSNESQLSNSINVQTDTSYTPTGIGMPKTDNNGNVVQPTKTKKEIEKQKKQEKGILEKSSEIIFNNFEKYVRRIDKAQQVFGLQIGNYFKCSQMIIKDFTITLSRELDSDGNPLFADLTFLVETREVMTKDKMGAIFTPPTPRVTVSNGGGAQAREEIDLNPNM